MSSKYMTQLARATGLPYYPKQGPYGSQPFNRSGNLIGAMQGYLVAAGLGQAGGNNKYCVRLLIRFKKGAQPAMLAQAIENSAAVAAAVGSPAGTIKVKKHFTVGDDFVDWPCTYNFRKPSPEKVLELLQAVIEAIRPIAGPFDSRCEMCQTPVTGITLLNKTPGYYCPACQEKTSRELDAAAREYAQRDSNLFAGVLYGAGAALLGSLAWGVIAYAIDTIFLAGAMLIGVWVGRSFYKGMGKVNWVGRIFVFAFTIASVLVGDAVFLLLVVMKRYHLAFSFHLLARVFGSLSTLERQNFGSVLFGVIGAAWVMYKVRAPSFRSKFEPLGAATPLAAQATFAGG